MIKGDERELRAAIVHVCRRLWERGLVAGRDGNVSARLGRDLIIATPAGFSKADLAPDDLVVLSTDGVRRGGTNEPSTEIALHLRAYERRGDIGAVVHAHPPVATGLAVAGETLPTDVLPEVTVLLGSVPLVDYAMPGTTALADRFDSYWDNHQAFLMANHGALTLGPTLRVAYQRMETVEHAACILAAARGFGRVRTLETADANALRSAHLRILRDE